MLNEVIFYAIDSKRYGEPNFALLLTKVSADKQCRLYFPQFNIRT